MAAANINYVNLFTNDKATKPNSPHWRGEGNLEVAGTIYRIRVVGWDKDGPIAGRYISLNLKIEGEQMASALPNSPINDTRRSPA